MTAFPPLGLSSLLIYTSPSHTYVNINTSPMPESYHQFKILLGVNTSIVQSRCCIFLQKKPWIYYSSLTINSLIDMTSKDTAAPSQDFTLHPLPGIFLSLLLSEPAHQRLKTRDPILMLKAIDSAQ